MIATTKLAATIRGHTCRVQRREADWNFRFGSRASIAVSAPWRIVTDDGVVVGEEDDGHQFGLPAPLDAESAANRLLADRAVIQVDVDELTADMRITFDGGVLLHIFNNSVAYEAWQASLLSSDGEEITVIGMGGGGLMIHRAE